MNEFAIHNAAANGDLERVRRLIEAVVPVDSLNKCGQTPLHRAAFYGQYEVARLLIDSKCDLDIKDCHGRTPIMSAALFYYKGSDFQKKGDIVDILLQRGARVNCIDNEGSTLLHHACNGCYGGRTDIVRLILNHGEADLNAVDGDGRTPLMLSVKIGNEEIAALLIQAGADVNRSNEMKRTALHSAVQLHRTRIIQILLQKEGLDLSPQDNNGHTPLHIACWMGYLEPINQLLDAGASPNKKNNQGITALGKVRVLSDLTIKEMRLFVQKGAFLEESFYENMSQDPFLKELLKDVEFCTQSIINKFHGQSLPALNSITYFAGRLPNVDNFKLGALHIDEVKKLVKCEIERNTFCNVVKVHPISLSALCVLSLITCQSGKKRTASPDFDYSPCKKIHN